MVAYNTSLPRAALGIIAGTIAGAFLVTLVVAFAQRDINILQILVFMWAALFWAAGLILIAPLPWAVLHHYQLRSWQAALVLGAVLTPLVVLGLNAYGMPLIGSSIWAGGRLRPNAGVEAIKIFLYCSAGGALVALVAWRTAYRRII
jgi:hypothetical protein